MNHAHLTDAEGAMLLRGLKVYSQGMLTRAGELMAEQRYRAAGECRTSAATVAGIIRKIELEQLTLARLEVIAIRDALLYYKDRALEVAKKERQKGQFDGAECMALESRMALNVVAKIESGALN